MRKYILIGLGGGLGAISRYLLEGVQIGNYQVKMPLNTFIINITGSFLLALLLTVALEVLDFDPAIRLGMATGFLGAYTTFSTFSKETATLFSSGEFYWAVSYAALSAILGLVAAYLGVVLAREVVSRLYKYGSKGRV